MNVEFCRESVKESFGRPRRTLKLDSKRKETGINCSRPRLMVGFCKHDTESVGSVRCIEFCD